MTVREGRQSRNAGSFLRKELPDRAEEHRKELTPLSSVAYGATRWPGFKVFA